MIRVEDLAIVLPGFALEDINLQVDPGEAFALLGPTGAGKTLLLEAIIGVVPVTRGRILIDGCDMTGLPPELVVPEVGEEFADSPDVVPVVVSDQLLEIYNSSDRIPWVSRRGSWLDRPARR